MSLRARTNGNRTAGGDKYLALLESAIMLGEGLIVDINAVEQISDIAVRAQRIATLAFVSFGIRTARALLLVVSEAGLGQQGCILARTIWESAVNLEYMLKEDDRAYRWLSFGVIQQMRLLQDKPMKYTDSGWAKDAHQRDITAVEEGFDFSLRDQYDEIVQKFGDIDKDGNGKKMSDWAGRVNLRDKAVAIKLEEDYDLLYDVLSQRAHASAEGLKSLYSTLPDGSVVPNKDDHPEVVIAVGNAVQFLLDILEQYCKTWGLPSSDINTVRMSLDALCPYYPAANP